MAKEKFDFIEVERELVESWQNDLGFVLSHCQHNDSKEALQFILNEIEDVLCYKKPKISSGRANTPEEISSE